VTRRRSTSQALASPALLLRAAVAAALLAAPAGLAACTRSASSSQAASSSAAVDPATQLKNAKQVLDAASSVHFTLSSDSSPKGATALVSGEGDVVRPDRFSGTLDVLVAGQKVRVKIISVTGTVYAQLFSATWSKVQPSQFGLNDPGTFMAPQGGLADLLSTATNATSAGEKRRGSEVLKLVSADVPGETVARVLTTKDPDRAVPAVFGIDSATGQLREATMTGPFFDTATTNTYTVVLDRYGQQVDIRAPIG
jgi:lipoprotein LprG